MKAALSNFGHWIGFSLLVTTQLAFGSTSPITYQYGNSEFTQLDVYAPNNGVARPIILMVHGGAWRFGDKNKDAAATTKANYFNRRGFIFVSINYRLAPKVTPYEQSEDILAAIKYVEENASVWGGDKNRLHVMGHSAGAHLVALVSANVDRIKRVHLTPWKTSIILDTAALDITQIMNQKHLRLYDQAFGTNPTDWIKISPIEQLQRGAIPMVIVCSTERPDSCPQATQFHLRAQELTIDTLVIPEAKSHTKINTDVGSDLVYTGKIESAVSKLLSAQ